VQYYGDLSVLVTNDIIENDCSSDQGFLLCSIHDKLKTGAYNPRAYAGKGHVVKICRGTAEYLRDILCTASLFNICWGNYGLCAVLPYS
jgi:hypothetical protein